MTKDPKLFFEPRQLYIIPEASPNSTSPEFVTTSNKNPNQHSADVKPQASPIGPISHELRERLLGKSPLRLIVRRVPQFVLEATQPKYWIETLECGHVTEAYQFLDDSDLFCSLPFAKRRRCIECQDALGIQRDGLPLPPETTCPVGEFAQRIIEYLFRLKFAALNPWAKDDYHVAAVAVIYAAQGYQQPWNRAFFEYYGKHFSKVLPYWLEQADKRSLLGPGLREGQLICPPKKPSTSVREIPNKKAGEL